MRARAEWGHLRLADARPLAAAGSNCEPFLPPATDWGVAYNKSCEPYGPIWKTNWRTTEQDSRLKVRLKRLAGWPVLLCASTLRFAAAHPRPLAVIPQPGLHRSRTHIWQRRLLALVAGAGANLKHPQRPPCQRRGVHFSPTPNKPSRTHRRRRAWRRAALSGCYL